MTDARELTSISDSTGRYFGEKPEEVRKLAYCDRFCDVCKDAEHVAATKDHLTPQAILMTQLPQIQSQAEEEWENQDDVDGDTGVLYRAQSVEAILPIGAERLPGLPGFAKASHLGRREAVDKGTDSVSEDDVDLDFPAPSEKGSNKRALLEPTDDHLPRVQEVLQEEEGDRVWVPRKRINRDLSRSESLVSHVDVVEQPREINVQVLSQTPSKATALAEELFPEIEDRARLSPILSGPISPPRAPLPKDMPSRQPVGPSRCECYTRSAYIRCIY